MQAWSGVQELEIADLVASGISVHLLSDRRAAMQYDNITRKLFSPLHLTACFERSKQQNESLRALLEEERPLLDAPAGVDALLATMLSEREGACARAVYWVCLQQALICEQLTEVERCNLLRYGFAYVLLAHLEQTRPAQSAWLGSAATALANGGCWG
jgi:hypothetical protein